LRQSLVSGFENLIVDFFLPPLRFRDFPTWLGIDFVLRRRKPREVND